MAFLKLDDFTVPLAAASPMRLVPMGAAPKEGITGEMRTAHVVILKQWSAVTKPIHYSKAWALANLILGNGHVWDFRNASLQSSGGAGPVSGYSGVAMKFTGGPFSDGHFLRLSSGGSITLRSQLTGSYTVLVKRWDGTSWKRYAFLDDGTRWREGVATASTFGWFSINGDGHITITGKNDASVATQHDVAEVVTLPWRAHSTMLSAWTGTKATRHSPMPVLDVSGDRFLRSSLQCHGSVSDSNFVDATIDGDRSGAHMQLAFTLTESPQLF